MPSTSKAEVEAFLRDFKAKLGVWSVLFSRRPKNDQTLLALEMTYHQAEALLGDLTAEMYSEGPLAGEVPHGPPLWVFGRIIKNREVYIKISMGPPGTQVLCISFHFSEHPMKFPFRRG